jgi:arsenite-transporting ATPase
MVIAEARRTATYLSLFGYGVDAVVANRLLPEAVTDPWFAQWKALQTEHLATIEEGFAPLPVLKAELAPDELVGIERLRTFADELYRDRDATAVLHPGSPLEVRTKGDTAELVLDLPFADRDDLELGRHHDELLVRVGAYRRALLLPDSLKRRTVTAASLRDGRLRVTFAAPASSSGTSRRAAGAGR